MAMGILFRKAGAASAKALLTADQSDSIKCWAEQGGWHQVQNEVPDKIENMVTNNKISSAVQPMATNEVKKNTHTKKKKKKQTQQQQQQQQKPRVA